MTWCHPIKNCTVDDIQRKRNDGSTTNRQASNNQGTLSGIWPPHRPFWSHRPCCDRSDCFQDIDRRWFSSNSSPRRATLTSRWWRSLVLPDSRPLRTLKSSPIYSSDLFLNGEIGRGILELVVRALHACYIYTYFICNQLMVVELPTIRVEWNRYDATISAIIKLQLRLARQVVLLACQSTVKLTWLGVIVGPWSNDACTLFMQHSKLLPFQANLDLKHRVPAVVDRCARLLLLPLLLQSSILGMAEISIKHCLDCLIDLVARSCWII